MKIASAVIAFALASVSTVTAQNGCNESFPDLSTAKGLNATGKATAEKCEATAKKVPSCAYSCLEKAAESIGCNFWDFGCQCTPDGQNRVRQATIPCVVQDCPIPTALEVQGAALDICTCAGFKTTTLSLMDLVGLSGLPQLVMSQGLGGGSSNSSSSKKFKLF